MKEEPLTNTSAATLGERLAKQGGSLDPRRMRDVMLGAAHVIDCDSCRLRSMILIGFEGRFMPDHFRPNVRIIGPDFSVDTFTLQGATRPLPTRVRRLLAALIQKFSWLRLGPLTKERRASRTLAAKLKTG